MCAPRRARLRTIDLRDEGRRTCSLSHVAAETDDGAWRRGLPPTKECGGQRRTPVERARAVGPAGGGIGNRLVSSLV
eukprot:COSAG02_NODE_12245_length_1574_cov_1.522712_2_plen_77_part_00